MGGGGRGGVVMRPLIDQLRFEIYSLIFVLFVQVSPLSFVPPSVPSPMNRVSLRWPVA